MRWPTVTAFGVSLIICVLGACNGGGSNTFPTAPSAPIVPPPALPPVTGERSEWTGTATLVSCSGNESICSDPNMVGQVGRTASDQTWSVRRSDTTIDLFYNGDRGFSGSMDGRRFVATYSFSTDHATLEGEFAEDGNSFEAVDTYVNALADYQTVWRHRAVRIQ